MSDNINKPPPPGPMLPIENDRLSDLEMERRRLRQMADAATPPELRALAKDTLKAFASSEKFPGAVNAKPKKQMSRILAVDATGRPKQVQPQAEPAPAAVTAASPEQEQPKLVFRPGADGTFVKIVDRPVPPNWPEGRPWAQKFIATHDNKPFAIAQDGYAAKLIGDALNTYFIAVYARQQAAAAAVEDANAFETPLAEENAQ